MTTKEQFLIDAQVYYYINETSSLETFNLMDNNIKDAIITECIDSGTRLDEYEVDYLIENNSPLLISYFESLIDDGEELTESDFCRLTLEQMDIWYKILHNVYIEDDAQIEWENHWIVDLYIKIKADWRDKQINSILND
jgi:hypothetical protein